MMPEPPFTKGLRIAVTALGTQIITVPNNYPSKGTGERGAFFYDREGNLLAIGQAPR